MVKMKRIVLLSMMVVFLGSLALTMASAQDSGLGDYARQVRKQKDHQSPATKKFDNDNIPMTDKLSVVGQEPTADPNATAGANNDASASSNAGTGTATPADQGMANPAKTAAEDEAAKKKQLYGDWKKKIQGQQGQVDLLARELDLLNREYRLRAASFYADAGNRLRNSGSWDKQDTEFKDQIAAKQKQLDDAKKQVDELQEQARKAGVPASMRE
jgi:hypothetical protein